MGVMGLSLSPQKWLSALKTETKNRQIPHKLKKVEKLGSDTSSNHQPSPQHFPSLYRLPCFLSLPAQGQNSKGAEKGGGGMAYHALPLQGGKDVWARSHLLPMLIYPSEAFLTV